MDCNEADEQLVLYDLDALDPADTRSMDQHVTACLKCSLKLREDGDVLVRLAYAAPQLQVPERVKQRLLSRIDRTPWRDRLAQIGRSWTGPLPELGRLIAAHSAVSVASLLVLAIVAAGVWFNGRLDSIADEKEVLASQIETMAESEARIGEMVQNQRLLSYMTAIPGSSVNMLSATTGAYGASGMVVVPRTWEVAVLVAIDLPKLAEDETYQVWLLSSTDGFMYSGGDFTVDSRGFGLTIIRLYDPPADFDAVAITVGRVGEGPTGLSILRGDL
jgi:hypothetical protein